MTTPALPPGFELDSAAPPLPAGFTLDSQAPQPSVADRIGSGIRDAAAGAIRGAGSIGATLMTPIDAGARALGIENSFVGRRDRREAMTGALQGMGADTDSLAFGAGKLGAEIAGTAGAGGVVANTAGRVAPRVAAAAPNLLTSIRTSGMTAGTGGNALANLGTRAAGGATAGAASAGLVDPSDAAAGGAVGAALPVALRGAGAAGGVVGKALRGGGVSDEVRALATRAQELGIEIPADRLVNSKPLNAVAAGLNYVPFSGRAATEAKLERQLSQATSRLIGQDNPNMTKALRDASSDLGGKFDATLRSTGVNADSQFLTEATDVLNTAQKELGSDAFRPIANQFNELIDKAATGTIDGQAAYNIKRTLDRLGRGNGPEAYHAIELKRVLMGALDRSLGPDEAAAFALTRQQYGNMIELEKLAKNGAEGDISVARLANLKNINNKPLQEIADIAAQFVKPREGQHGAAQRALLGGGVASVAGLPVLAGSVAAGRVANTAMNSNFARNALLNTAPQSAPGPVNRLLYRSAPVLAGGDQ